ncbi:hypothetical protein MiSe_95130 [Microseira wollei NIES-4236]|uniref:Uncharacterized protein n=1 Tax=Microseira wollei NIES-4236 TaxID=2530354 RepID=A0AAV3XUA2_9CYAN|nr:hypothetical protein MiSe_95130 [Microseira wollei NIES-4236]
MKVTEEQIRIATDNFSVEVTIFLQQVKSATNLLNFCY